MEMAIASAAGLVWLEDDPYAKALRAGLAMTTLLQLSTVWSIHLPYGFARLLTVAVVITGFVLAHWIDQNNMIGLALTSAAAMGGVAYALTAMRSNHGLHRNSAGRAAAARASDAAKSLFLAQMSHELRSPLNAIIGLGEVEAARAQGLSQDRLRALVTSARGLAVVLDDVLDLAAITDGRVAISPAPTDLRATLQAAMALLEPEAINSGTRFDLILPADLPSHVALDAQRLRQCLTNLVGNVIKHAAGSSVRITSEQRAGLLTSFVADAGPGVPTALAQTLFEPFHRGCANLPGLGLGLGINRSPARQMGRDLIHAPAARGAVFRLLVTAPKEPAPPPATELPVLGGRRILVVDDIATNRLVAASLLHALGPRWSRLMAGPRRYFWLRGRDRPCVSGHGDARDGRI